jgi:tetratricopeptide (TPR) repeat protein
MSNYKSKPNISISSDIAAAITTSVEVDIIQPKRRILQNYLLIWLDPDIDESNKDCQNSLVQLRNIVNDVYTYTHIDECIDFLSNIDDQKAFMIISGTLAQKLIPNIHDIPQLEMIYVYFINQVQHEQWIKEWFKVKRLYTQLTLISEDLQAAVKHCDEDSIPISLVIVDEDLSNKNFDQLEPSFMYTQIFKEIFLQMDYDRLAINDFTNYCRSGDYGSKSTIDRFEVEYRSHLAIWWYTYPSFLFSMLNRALRTLDSTTMMKMGFFIRDLHHQIEEFHQHQFDQQYNDIFIVYRGQGLSLQDFEKLQKTKGGLISFNNFLSTSKERDLSLGFAKSTLLKIDSVGILFRMSIDPSISSTPFAIIDKVSYFKAEKEVLFSMHTVFRIIDIHKIENNDRLYHVELKLTADNDPQLQMLTKYIREDTYLEAKGWHRMGLLLITLGHFDQAEQVYLVALQQTDDEKEKVNIYFQLGIITEKQGDYTKALLYSEKAVNICQKVLPPSHHLLALSYSGISRVLNGMGEYSKALLFYEKTREIYQKIFPSNHPNLATLFSNIGLVYINLGEYSKALSYYEKTLDIDLKTLPPNHPSLAISYDNIGTVYHNMGQYSKALSFLEKSLDIKEKTLPSDHHSLITCFSNIGSSYIKMGEYSKALSFCVKVVDIQEKSLPSDHPNLATSYNNIGALYHSMGEYSKALSFCEKALDIKEKTLPQSHPLLANCYCNISLLYDNMGQYSKALSFSEKALEIRQKTLPSDHPDLATSYNNIGGLYYSMGKYSKALLFYEKALNIREKTLSPNHPDMGESYNNIGLMYNYMEEYSNALSFSEKALEIRQKTLPSDHPDLATSYNNIGLVYNNIGECSKAISFFEKSLKIQESILPSNHPDIARSYDNISWMCNQMGEYSKALSFSEKSLEIKQNTFATCHPVMAHSYSTIGCTYISMEEYSKAISFLEKAIEIRQKTLSPSHPHIAESYENIGVAYVGVREYSKALSFFERALHIWEHSLDPNHSYIRRIREIIRKLKE